MINVVLCAFREGLLAGSLSSSSSSPSSSLGCVAQASPRKLYIAKYFWYKRPHCRDFYKELAEGERVSVGVLPEEAGP